MTIDHINSIEPPVTMAATICIITVTMKADVVEDPTEADVAAFAYLNGK